MQQSNRRLQTLGGLLLLFLVAASCGSSERTSPEIKSDATQPTVGTTPPASTEILPTASGDLELSKSTACGNFFFGFSADGRIIEVQLLGDDYEQPGSYTAAPDLVRVSLKSVTGPLNADTLCFAEDLDPNQIPVPVAGGVVTMAGSTELVVALRELSTICLGEVSVTVGDQQIAQWDELCLDGTGLWIFAD